MLEVWGLGETGDHRAETGKERHSLADQAALTTEARGLVTCAELALRDVQNEGVGRRAEVAGALSQGETEGRGQVTPLGPWGEPRAPTSASGPLSSVLGGHEQPGARLLGLSPGSALPSSVAGALPRTFPL